MKTRLKIENDMLNIELKPGDKILVELLNGKKKGYIFNELSPHKEYRLSEVKTNTKIVVGLKWFTYEKNSYLWEED